MCYDYIIKKNVVLRVLEKSLQNKQVENYFFLHNNKIILLHQIVNNFK